MKSKLTKIIIAVLILAIFSIGGYFGLMNVENIKEINNLQDQINNGKEKLSKEKDDLIMQIDELKKDLFNKQQNQTKLTQQINDLQEQINNPQDQNKISVSNGVEDTNSFIIPNLNLKIIFPSEYSLVKNKEKNRRGSFVSYDFKKSGEYDPAQFYEIQFFSEQSIRDYTKDCDFCFDGDYPNTERYLGQKKAFSKLQDYTQEYEGGYKKEFKLKKFNNRYFFVSFFQGLEYTTYINDIKIDIWMFASTREDDLQKDESDKLFSKLKIEEL